MLTKTQLRQDQKDAIKWLKDKESALVILPVGFGKTVVTLTALHDTLFEQNLRVLVVSTKNIVLHTWGQEIREWDHLQDLDYRAACGSKKAREAAIRAKPQILGINFENLEKFYDMVDEDPSLLPDILVIDESSKMKDASTNRVKRHCGFRKKGGPRMSGYVQRYSRCIALTATPNPEGYAGLWAQEACISMSRLLGINITEFRANFCSSVWNGVVNTYKVTVDGERRIEEALRPICYAAPDAKYMDLPDPIHSRIEVPWTFDAREEYETMQKEFIVRIEGELRDKGIDPRDLNDTEYDRAVSKIIEAPNGGVKLSKLRQACSGFFYDSEGEAHDTADPHAKLAALESYLERVGDAPVVIFVQFVVEQRDIEETYPDFQIGLPKSLDAWNAGDVPALVLHPRSAGHGVNLQKGSHNILWYSLPFSYEEWHQANGRLHRTGQTRQVSITRIVRPDSVDQYVWSKLHSKGRKLDQFITSMRSK